MAKEKMLEIFIKWVKKVVLPWVKKYIWPLIQTWIIENIMDILEWIKKRIIIILRRQSDERQGEANKKASEADMNASKAKDNIEAEKYKAIAEVWRQVAEQYRVDKEILEEKYSQLIIKTENIARDKVGKTNFDEVFVVNKDGVHLKPIQKMLPPPTED